MYRTPHGLVTCPLAAHPPSSAVQRLLSLQVSLDLAHLECSHETDVVVSPVESLGLLDIAHYPLALVCTLHKAWIIRLTSVRAHVCTTVSVISEVLRHSQENKINILVGQTNNTETSVSFTQIIDHKYKSHALCWDTSLFFFAIVRVIWYAGESAISSPFFQLKGWFLLSHNHTTV